MKCKKCENTINKRFYRGIKKTHEELIKLKNNGTDIPDILLNMYKNYHAVFLCENCDEPINYMDMPVEMFFDWLKYSSEAGDSREMSGKALIRYFDLDKLLQLKKDAGD